MNHIEKQQRTLHWFNEKLKAGEISFTTKIKLLDLLMKDIEAKSISDYAKDNNISYNGVGYRVDAGKLHAISLNNSVFVFEEIKKEVPEYLN